MNFEINTEIFNFDDVRYKTPSHSKNVDEKTKPSSLKGVELRWVLTNKETEEWAYRRIIQYQRRQSWPISHNCPNFQKLLAK